MAVVFAAAIGARLYVMATETSRFNLQSDAPLPWHVSGVWLLLAGVALAAGCVGRRLNALAAAGAGGAASVIVSGLIWGPGHWIHFTSLGALLWALAWGGAAARITLRETAGLAAVYGAGAIVGYLAPTAIFNSRVIAWLDGALLAALGTSFVILFVRRLRSREQTPKLWRRFSLAAGALLAQLVCLFVGVWLGFAIDTSLRLHRITENPDDPDRKRMPQVASPWEVARNVRFITGDPWASALAIARGSIYLDTAFLWKRSHVDDLLAFPEVTAVSVFGPGPSVRRLAAFHHLQTLDLNGADCTDADLAFLGDLPGPLYLRFMNCNLDGEFLKFLAGTAPAPVILPGKPLPTPITTKFVFQLELSNCPLKSEPLRRLNDIPTLAILALRDFGLNELDLSSLALGHQLELRSNLDDDDLAGIAWPKKMGALNLSGNPIRGPGLKYLPLAAGAVSRVELASTLVDDQGLRYLPKEVPGPIHLSLANTKVEGPGLAELAHLPLESLDLRGLPIEPDDLIPLQGKQSAGAEPLEVLLSPVEGYSPDDYEFLGLKIRIWD